MDRRMFCSAIAVGAAVTRSLAEAQSAIKVYRVGFLLGATRESVAPLFNALREGMEDLGYIVGRNVLFEQRYGGGRTERLPEPRSGARAPARRRHRHRHEHPCRSCSARDGKIPIVMVFAFDPVGSGFVASLAHPGETSPA
jgi:putative ABC transport system substrate-binding protein